MVDLSTIAEIECNVLYSTFAATVSAIGFVASVEVFGVQPCAPTMSSRSVPSRQTPYVCNGCSKKKSCTLEKRVYSARKLTRVRGSLSEARQGVQLTEEEALRLDTLISPLLKKGQSLHHIWVNHRDEIMVHKRSLYNYVAYWHLFRQKPGHASHCTNGQT